jgi:hypothetical protein
MQKSIADKIETARRAYVEEIVHLLPDGYDISGLSVEVNLHDLRANAKAGMEGFKADPGFWEVADYHGTKWIQAVKLHGTTALYLEQKKHE